ncbi:hypothetical protein 109_060 [Pseudomonas phage 109]|uniref:Phage protein n=1 Tax=Pseudomonas phage 109 TaxID=3056216 RepID=A0AAX4B0S1_9CAUD|nr:hypothetical protein 109_060 [Pseudomonas phage 109]
MLGVFTSLLSSRSFSIVDQNTNQLVAADLRISRVNTRFSSVGQRHMLEDGTTKMDSRTVHPMEIIVEVFCPSIDVVDQINQLLLDRDTLYKVITRGMVFERMMCTSEALNQTPEMISATPARLTFSQVLVQNPKPIMFRNAGDSSIIDRGLALAEDVVGSASDLFDYAVNGVQNAADLF